MEEPERKMAHIFKSLSDENRVRIVLFLRDGEQCVCEIVPHIGTSQSNISQHLRVLRDAGIIDYRRDGKRMMYFIANDAIIPIIDRLALNL